MLQKIKTIAIFFFKSILVFLSCIVLYLLAVVVFTIIPSNQSWKQPESGVTIYIKSNGVHTDLIVPTINSQYNWSEKILPKDYGLVNTAGTWTAFGWGDKGFYLNTPNWSDLKVSTALGAILPFVGGSAMHVTIYENTPIESEHVKKIIITPEQYLVLCDYIVSSFEKNETGNFTLIGNYHYNGVNDNFYEAVGSYHLLNTCNNWANKALKTTGVKTASWAPFDKCIFYHFK